MRLIGVNCQTNSKSLEISAPPSFSLNEVDIRIRERIEKITAEDSSVWTSPDYNRREYAHSFFQYPAMMIPIVQKKLIEVIVEANPSIKDVIDPFMGSATSLVACMQSGLNCYGQDINPLSILIGKVRTGPYYVEEIEKEKTALFSEIDADTSVQIEAKLTNIAKWFKPLVAQELSAIVRAIRKRNNPVVRRFLWVNLAETVRLTSNDRTSTFKLHARAQDEIERRNPSPIKEFKSRIESALSDLVLHRKLLSECGQINERNAYKQHISFSLQDSSKYIFPTEKDTKFDLLITSPPYGDNKTTVTYGQHSYLPLNWIDFSDIDLSASIEVLRTTQEIDSRSLGGKLRSLSEIEIDALSQYSPNFKVTYSKLLASAPEKANKVVVFLQDLFQVIERIFEVMKPNSYQVWTIGNRTVGSIEIPNNRILEDFIAYKGGMLVARVERDIINKRMAKRNNSAALMNTEDILIFRKIG